MRFRIQKFTTEIPHISTRKSLNYRPELDGLRAVAVIAVIIYHAQLNIFNTTLFKGGFLGVDVFFVLSGFLMTSIVKQQLESGCFSYSEFIIKRCKRIIPSYLVVLFTTALISYLLLTQEALYSYANSLAAALTFTSNHFFLNENSYSSPESILKPLLHTWSLSVEGQYYLIFPVIYLLAYRKLNKHLLTVLSALCFISFGSAIFLSNNFADLSFYSLPTRAWELLVGGLIPFFPTKIKITFGERLCSYISIVSLILIVISFSILDHHIAHPSWLTLIPVLSTASIIYFSNSNTKTFNILSIKLLTKTGVISYSLYLWHLPIFSYFHILRGEEITLQPFLLLVFVSFGLSILTTKYIEQPFRVKTVKIKLIASGFFLLIITSSLCKFLLTYEGQITNPLQFHVLQNIGSDNYFKLKGKSCLNRPFKEACRNIADSGESIILLGDSHAGRLALNLFKYAQKRRINFISFANSGCLGIDGIYAPFKKVAHKQWFQFQINHCKQNSPKYMKYIDEAQPSIIVFFARMPMYTGGKVTLGKQTINITRQLSTSSLKKINIVFKHWQSLGHQVIIIYPVPHPGLHIPNTVAQFTSKYISAQSKQQAFETLDLSTPLSGQKDLLFESYSILDSVKGNLVRRVYPLNILCSEITNRCMTHSKESVFYTDASHLSNTANEMLVREVIKQIE